MRAEVLGGSRAASRRVARAEELGGSRSAAGRSVSASQNGEERIIEKAELAMLVRKTCTGRRS